LAKNGSEALAGGLPEHRDRHREQTLGIVEARNIAGHSGSKVAQDPIIGGNQRHA